jgi:hypothetical protein
MQQATSDQLPFTLGIAYRNQTSRPNDADATRDTSARSHVRASRIKYR